MSYIIGSFYTKDTIYEKIINKYLKRSLDRLNLKYYFIEKPNLGGWQKNVAQKADSILELLEKYQNSNLVFLDADAEVLRPLAFFDEIDEYRTIDIGCHILEWASWYNRPNDRTRELLTGTMYLQNNNKIKNLIKTWSYKAINSNKWEQQILQSLLNEQKYSYTFLNLPLKYCYIRTMPNGSNPYVFLKNPVIIHNQVSRKLKGKSL